MKTSVSGPNAIKSIRVLLIAICIIAITPRLFGNIILNSRLSDAEAYAYPNFGSGDEAPVQSQTGFLPANLCNSAYSISGGIGPHGIVNAGSTSNSFILINIPMEGLRVTGDGTTSVDVNVVGNGRASAKLIVLSFTLTEVSYPYSIKGQLNGALCSPSVCTMATAKLTSDTGTIFEKVGTTSLSESGTLPPGNYTLSVDVYASTTHVGTYVSDANFTFELDGPMSTPTPTPIPIPVTRATNLSGRVFILNEQNVCIGGFIITGTGTRRILIRGIGPSLGDIISDALPDPLLQLSPSRCSGVTNNNWRDTQEAEIIATGRAPSNDLESAIVANLTPGPYTVILRDGGLRHGVGVVEIFDLSDNQDSKLANISTRGNVIGGDDIMIAGFILGGGSGQDTVILRGIGPSLGLGVGDGPTLRDPKLELRNSEGGLIASNDNWMDDPNQAAIIQAAGLAPSNNLESAIAVTLMPGEYTALLSGETSFPSVGLVEVYDLGAPAH